MSAQVFLDALRERASSFDALPLCGRVSALVGTVVEAEGVRAPLGSLHRISSDSAAADGLLAEVIGFRDRITMLMPLGDAAGLAPGAAIRALPRAAQRPAARDLLGRVVDGLATPIDGRPRLLPTAQKRLATPSTLRRKPVQEPLDVGVRSLNALATIGRGTRTGLFAGAGVGKSTLLGQIARFSEVDCFVVALVGERGREVREFIEGELGDALGRAIVVVATSEEAPVLRRRAAELATTLAEELRDDGRQVLLLMDSLTRVCAAQREIGLAAGEPPATRGYPPSVWSALPKLLERVGTSEGEGCITGVYSVLVEGDDLDEPVADAARSLLDGHIVLSRRLAERGQYPAVDVLASVSRTMPRLVTEEAVATATAARGALADYAEVEDLISIGAYQAGADPRADRAVALQGPLREFLCQAPGERCDLATSQQALLASLGAQR